MSDANAAESERGGAVNSLRTAGRLVFGDRYGLALFLATTCFAMLYWRAGIFITDNATLVRTLEALSEGRVWLEPATGTHFDGPGADVRDGYVYGRNYGQLVLSLPALWLLQGIDLVADLRVALVALWHLLLLGLFVQLGQLLNRERVFVLGGSGLVLLLFGTNLAFATTLRDPNLELLALQATTLLAAGLTAVVAYRLVAFQFNHRLGLLVGGTIVLVLPVGFWATIPKRHVFTVLACMAVLYFFARSREPGATVALPVVGSVPGYRAAAYATVGLLSWIHAAEGMFVFLALVAVDLPTAPSNDHKSLAFVAVVFALSMVPTVVTNWLVGGHPYRPPRAIAGSGFADPAAAPAEPTSPDASADTSLLDLVPDIFPFSAITFFAAQVSDLVFESVAALFVTDTMYHTFFRSAGATIDGGHLQYRDANLSLFESAPILGALVGTAIAAVLRWRPSLPSRPLTACRQWLARRDPTATLAVLLILVFFAIYLSRLPTYVQINLRYVLPVYPLGLYLLMRTVPLRRLVDTARDAIYWSYAAGVLVGGQLFLLTVALLGLSVAEASQLNALLALALAGYLLVTVVAFHFDDRFRLPAAIGLSLAAAAGTVYLLVSGVHYFAHVGELLLPIVEVVSTRL